MNTIKYLMIFSLLFTFTVMAQDNDNTTTKTTTKTKVTQSGDWSKVKKTIEDMNRKMTNAMVNNDQAYLMSLYTDDAISLPNYSQMVKGKNGIQDMGKKDIEMGTKYKSFNTQSTDFYGDGKYAYDLGTFTINLSTNKMPDIKDHGKYLQVWERQNDGTWKIKVEMWNSDVNPYESMMSEKEGTTHEKAGVKADQNKSTPKDKTDIDKK